VAIKRVQKATPRIGVKLRRSREKRARNKPAFGKKSGVGRRGKKKDGKPKV